MAEQDPDFSSSAQPDETRGDEPEPLESPASRESSLTADLLALVDDGKTYVEAEVQFQKTRAAFAFEKGKAGAFYGMLALALLHLALVGLVVGTIFALIPLIGAWAATALVVGLLAIAGAIFAWRAKSRFERLADAYRETRE